MARSHARLQFGLWRKPGHTDVSKNARFLYVTILGDAGLNQAGVVTLRPSLWAEDAAMTDDETAAALCELEHKRFVVVDERTRELLVRTFIRNDGVADQPNVLRHALALAMGVASPKLRRVIAAELRKLPPAPPNRTTSSGRVFAYPDPHAVARALDPDDGVPPGDGLPEPPGNPSRNPLDESGTGTLHGTLHGTHARTPSGRGGGKGYPQEPNIPPASSTDATTDRAPTPNSDPTPSPTPAPRPRGDRAVAEALNATAHSAEARTILRKWTQTSENEPLPPTTITQLARQIDTLRERDATGAYVWAALLTWDEKRRNGDNPKPGLLPYLHDEIKLEGLTAAQIYATPVEYLRDEDIDLYEVLGFDDLQIEAPPDIENGPMDIRHNWYAQARAQRRTERCVQARDVIKRRQEIRRQAKGAA